MKNINGRIRFGGNALTFKFSGTKMDVDVETERAFTEEERDTVNDVIGDLTRICLKLSDKIEFGNKTNNAPHWLASLFPPKKVLKSEEKRTIYVTSAKFASDVRKIPDCEHEGRFYIELDGIRLIEENGEISGWYIP